MRLVWTPTRKYGQRHKLLINGHKLLHVDYKLLVFAPTYRLILSFYFYTDKSLHRFMAVFLMSVNVYYHYTVQ